MRMNKKKDLIPKLRFSEFFGNGEWGKESFDKLYTFKPTNSFSREKLNYQKGEIRNIHYGDIHTKFSALFNIEKELVPFINSDESLHNIKKDSFCLEGDVIFADASEDLEGVGKSIELINLNDEKLLSGLHTILARPRTNKIILGFGGYLFRSSLIRRQIQKESQGAKVLGISASRLSNIKVLFPKKKSEQQKIVDCLISIDALITAEDKKIEILKEQKKGLMQKLFPAEGRRVPEWRFPEFKDSGDWETSSLGFLAVRVTKKNNDESLTRVLTNSAINGVVDQQDFFDKDIANKSNLANYYILDEGDYVYNPRISVTAPVGPISRNNVGKGVISPLYTVFRFKNASNDYFEHFFRTTGWHSYLKNISNTGARHDRMSISSDAFMNMPLTYPTSQREQRKIAECLSNLDCFITAQACKIEVLQAHKKGLMQGLFPSVEAVSE